MNNLTSQYISPDHLSAAGGSKPPATKKMGNPLKWVERCLDSFQPVSTDLSLSVARGFEPVAALALLLTFALLFTLTLPIHAQGEIVSTPIPNTFVSDDAVNRVARGLYCPVCPNERLDTCQTVACAAWREDIRGQLASGQSDSQIVADFVDRYGERAAGTPQGVGLRALSYYVPFGLAALALVLGIMTFLGWRGRRTPITLTPAADATRVDAPVVDDLRARLERDLEL